MASGHAGNDLSRITTGPWRAECSMRLCRWSAPEQMKSRALRLARGHAAQGAPHDVILIAETMQRVAAARL